MWIPVTADLPNDAEEAIVTWVRGERRMSKVRVCGNDYVYCDGKCDKCPGLIPTYATSSTDTVYRVERKEE